ncbi:hypothetical protein ACP70R_041025 [Stipagrostis hirtigluma subsp. patula]
MSKNSHRSRSPLRLAAATFRDLDSKPSAIWISTSMGRKAPPPPPTPLPPLGDSPEGLSRGDLVKWLGHGGAILVLFETPSGFALFTFYGVNLYLPHALENIWVDFTRKSRANEVIWLVEFQIFEDKASAINNETGVNRQLAQMITKNIRPGQKLAVGNKNYQEIIQKSLEIHCLYNDAVLEIMWGLKNLMKDLVPKEVSDFPSNDDRYPQMSKGMKRLLERNGFVVEPEMVNENIIELSALLYDSDFCVKKHNEFLQLMAPMLISSNIKCQKWGSKKMAIALLVLCSLDMEIKTGDSTEEMFSETEVMELRDAAPQYTDRLDKRSCLRIYKEILWTYQVKSKVKSQLSLLVGTAKDTEGEQGGSEKPSEHLPEAV